MAHHIMILATILAVPILGVQVGQATETKLFTVQKGRVMPGSIMLSPDQNHFSYTTGDHKVILDGKSVGEFPFNATAVYSGNSADCAFLTSLIEGGPAKLIWNGVERKTEFQVVSVFRAGETGGICYVERKTEKVEDGVDEKGNVKFKNVDSSRLVTPDETTPWCRKIDKIGFSDDGSQFFIRTNEEIVRPRNAPVDPNAETTKDFLIYKGGQKVARDQVMQVFPAPKGEGYALLTLRNEVIFKGQSTVVHGEFYGKPLFSPTGKLFAFRSEYTSTGSNGVNIPVFHYYIGGNEVTGLQIQTGLTFDETGRKWVMCGANGKSLFLYQSTTGLLSYADAGLADAPPEAYKAAKYADGKLVLLFQAKRGKPMLFIEDKGMVELGTFVSFPDTLSISPDGKRLLIAGSAGEELHAYFVDLQIPGAAADVLKGSYELQSLGKGTFVWNGDHDVQFSILRKNDLTRVRVKL